MIIAQITDTHLRGGRHPVVGCDTASALERCVEDLCQRVPAPDVVLATGDLVDDGSDEGYGVLTDILSPLPMPVLPIPGNHDERSAFRRAFSKAPGVGRGDGPVRYALDDWPVRLIALDTVIPGEIHGALHEDDLGWLESRLGEAPDSPTLVFLHHPPFRTGLVGMDSIGLLTGASALGDVIARHPQVERVAAGHVHRSILTRWRGTVATVAPSTARQIALELRADVKPSYTMEPPGYHLHVWKDGALITHLAPIGPFADPDLSQGVGSPEA